MLEKLKKGETVECMIIENGGRTIRRDGKMAKLGNLLLDSFTGEAYAIVTKPLLLYKKNKSIPVYLVDREAGVTVTVEPDPANTEHVTEHYDNPGELIINGYKFAGWTCTLERTAALQKLNTVPHLIGRAIESQILADRFSAPLTGREKIIMVLIGLVIGFILRSMFG